MTGTIFRDLNGKPDEAMGAASEEAHRLAKAFAAEVRKLAAMSLSTSPTDPSDKRTPKEIEDTEAMHMSIMMMANALDLESDESAFAGLAIAVGAGLANTVEDVFTAAAVVGNVGTHALSIFSQIKARQQPQGSA